jgi:hypothetical protein
MLEVVSMDSPFSQAVQTGKKCHSKNLLYLCYTDCKFFYPNYYYCVLIFRKVTKQTKPVGNDVSKVRK